MSIGVGLRGFILAVSLAALTGAANAQVGSAPPINSGPRSSLVEPSGGFVGRLALTPDHGPIGAPVTVTGTGLPANQTLDLVWRTVKGSWQVADAEYHGRKYTPVGYLITKVKTDASGGFTATFDAPDDFGFWHDITVQTADRLLTQAAFNVRNVGRRSRRRAGRSARRSPSTSRASAGKQLENSWLLLYDNKYTGWMSSVTTGGSAHFTIPAAGKPGTHVLEVLHGDFTFPYRNMQQSPEPDRPRFAIPFEITDGDPVLPPAADEQAQTSMRDLPPQGELVAEPRVRDGRPADHGHAARASRRARATSSTGRRSPATASAAAAGRRRRG